MRFARTIPISVLVALGAACSASNPPTQLLAEAQARIRAAKEIGADAEPQARLHLKLASDQTREAEQLIAEGEHAQAALLLERAGDDAALALATARERRAATEARDALERAAELQRELGRTPAGKER